MKTLYLARHAKSDWKTIGQNDYDRPLNKRGREDAPVMAKRLIERNSIPEYIKSSSAVRTTQTSNLFLNEFVFPSSSLELIDNLYLADYDTIQDEIWKTADSISSLMIVAHNPGIEYAISHFINQMIERVPTCAIAKIEFPKAESWTDVQFRKGVLVFFDYPKNTLSALV
jgi:phosphohistidine phosphatase